MAAFFTNSFRRRFLVPCNGIFLEKAGTNFEKATDQWSMMVL
jgi:hypothetical protein